jgi:hypothetical protein
MARSANPSGPPPPAPAVPVANPSRLEKSVKHFRVKGMCSHVLDGGGEAVPQHKHKVDFTPTCKAFTSSHILSSSG